MRATAQFNNTGDIEATITISATIEQWTRLRDEMRDLPFYGVAQQLRTSISSLTDQLCGRVHYDPPSDEGEA